MWNLLTNIGAWVIICLLIFVSTVYDRKNFRRPSLIAIVLTAILVAVSVVLTNLLGYSLSLFSTFIKLSFGAFIIFVCGMLFGPFIGCLAGLASDSIGAIINIQGGYSAIFTLESILYGFMGGLVLWRNKENYWWVFRLIIYYNFVFIISSFALDSMWLALVYGVNLTKVMMIVKLIKWPLEIIIYLALSFLVFTMLYYLLRNATTASQVWCMRWSFRSCSKRWTKRFNGQGESGQTPSVI